MNTKKSFNNYDYKDSKKKGIKVLVSCIIIFFMIYIITNKKTYWWTIIYITILLFVIELIMYTSTNLSYYDMINPKVVYGTIMDSNELNQYLYIPKSNEYKDKVNLGYKVAKTKKIIILCLTRDVDSYVEMTRNKLESIGKDFLEYKIVLFENDSEDNTRKLLKNWMSENKNVDVMDCCHLGSCECLLKNEKGYEMGQLSKGRISKMRYYRETLLRYATQKYSNYDYVMIYDFDISGIVYKDGLMTSFSSDTEWDMVFANGLQSYPRITMSNLVLYDTLPYIPEELSYNHELSLIQLDRHHKKLRKHNIGSDLVKCKSGFNGMAIYKMKCLKNSSYMNNTEKYCEHLDLHKDMYNKGYNKIYYNPSMVLFVGQAGPHRSQVIFNEFHKYFKKINK
jgi:hypothetical protein